jgi:hypothetical protein
MSLVNFSQFPVGRSTPLYYIDENYKVQVMTITPEMVESGSVKIPCLPYNKADYELYVKNGKVFTSHFNEGIVIYTDKETGVVQEPFACAFVSWSLRDIFPRLGRALREKVKRENKERYPLVAFVDAKTSEILSEVSISDYYKNHKGLCELEKVVKLNSDLNGSDIVVKTYDKETDEWVLFELRRLAYWKALEDTKAQVQAEVQRWKEDL